MTDHKHNPDRHDALRWIRENLAGRWEQLGDLELIKLVKAVRRKISTRDSENADNAKT